MALKLPVAQACVEMSQSTERQAERRRDSRIGTADAATVYKRQRRLKFVVGITICLICASPVIFWMFYLFRFPGIPDVKNGVYKQAAVASDSHICSHLGRDILIGGGNAVDAAIACLLCGGLTSPQSLGIGGGFFMTIYNRTSGNATIIDARETAPERATATMFKGHPSASASGPLSIAVPGEVQGYWLAHSKYGHLPWRDLFQPAIRMARDGFPVPIALHKAIQDDKKVLMTEPSLRMIFINPKTGNLFKQKEIIKRAKLAQTLKIIAHEGAKAFYNGSLTDNIIADLKEIGSIITKRDLNNYKAVERRPIEVVVNEDIKMVSPPPPAGGVVLSFIMNILDGYSLTDEDLSSEETALVTYQRLIEAFKFAYAKRTALGDQDFVNITELVKNLTSTAYANSIRKLITDSATHDYSYYGPTFYSQGGTTGTSHLSVLDQYGNAVSVTSTINSRFGSKRCGERTGIIFNNQMDDFSSPNITNLYGIQPSPANFIAPGKRPLSSMCPAVFINSDGTVNAVLGAAGGAKIITATAWIAAHIVWFGAKINEIVDIPRLHHQLLPPRLEYEAGFKESLVAALQKLGHNVSEYPVGQSIIQGIQVIEGSIYAVSDYRKGGAPDGF